MSINDLALPTRLSDIVHSIEITGSFVQWDDQHGFVTGTYKPEGIPAVLWYKFCNNCEAIVRLTLREMNTDFVQSPASGLIINSAGTDCFC